MSKTHYTILRHWHMLRLIPRYPNKITAQALQKLLAENEFPTTDRTIQRDLVDLSSVFPLVQDGRDKPYGWSWHKDAPTFDLPGLTAPEALTLALVEQYLRDLLPACAIDQLKPHFKAAHRRLDQEPKTGTSRSWLDKVRTVPPAQPLLPPRIDPHVQATISNALLHERQVEIQYRRRGQQEAATHRIHPLTLVQRGPLIYLFCRFYDYAGTRKLALHRISSATVLDDPAVYPADFSIDRTIELGVWGYGKGRMIQVELLFQRESGEHLHETPLSHDQTAEELQDGSLRVMATVADTPQLRWWLRGFGSGVEVIAPAFLREEMADTAQRTAALYASAPVEQA